MMNNATVYTNEQNEKVLAFIEEEFGGQSVEIQGKEYEDMKILAVQNAEGLRTYMTHGIGAKEILSLKPSFRRIEVMIHTSARIAWDKAKETVLCEELTEMGRQFAAAAWVEEKMSVRTSQEFKKSFDYSGFLVFPYENTCSISDSEFVTFLCLVPLYAKESWWIDDLDERIELYVEGYKKEAAARFLADVKREGLFIPDGCAFSEEEILSLPYMQIEDNTLLKYIPDVDGELIIPEGVEKIGPWIFSWEGLHYDGVDHELMNGGDVTSVRIPASVKEIAEGAFLGVIYSIEALEVDPANESFISADGVLYTKDKKKLICCPREWKNHACERYEIPERVEVIGEGAFENCSFETIRLPESLRVIKDGAFANCEKLKEIHIPDSVETMGRAVFANCRELRAIGFSPESKVLSENELGIFSKDGKNLHRMKKNESGDYVVPDGVTAIEKDAFLETDNMVSVSIPEGVKEILPFTFLGKRTLKRAVLPESLEMICEGAFCHCSALEDIQMGNGLKLIGKDAFWGCRSLRKILLPDTLQVIEESAFACCEGLEELSLPEDLKKIGDYVFMNCASLGEVHIPDAVEDVGEDLFWMSETDY